MNSSLTPSILSLFLLYKTKVKMGTHTKGDRCRFLPVIFRKYNKKRAISFDKTVESDVSLDACEAIITNSDSNSYAMNHATPSLKDSTTTTSEKDQANFLSEDPLYQNEVVLRNRIAALNAQQILLGKYHPDVLFALQNLAALHYRRGEYSHAQQVFKEHKDRREHRNSQEKGGIHNTIPSEIFIM